MATAAAVLLVSCSRPGDVAGGQSGTTAATTPPPSATTDTTPAPSVAAVKSFHPEGMGWELVWSDEFDGAELDESKWGWERNCWGGGNQELQCYTDRADNTVISDGMLHIRALQEQFTGLDGSADWENADELGTATLPFTSGRIRSKGKGDWRYGRFEIRAKLPYGQGLWPAIWMLPTDGEYGGWAASGEIDIMEAVNLKTVFSPDSNAVHGTLHYGAEWPANVNSGTFIQLFQEHPSDAFHVYAIEWEEGEIRWFVDDVHYATQTADGWYSQVTAADGTTERMGGTAPFDQRFHLLLNVAVGGTWPGPPNDETEFPQEMLVDYVRVYQCGVSPGNGLGCATSQPSATLVEGKQPPEPTETLFAGPFAGTFDPMTLGATMTIFTDDQIYPWKWDSFNATGSLDFELIDTEDPDHGTVIQTTFNTNEAVVYFQAPVTYDLTDWTEGFVEFDLRVLDLGARARGFMMKVDCVHPCSSGDFSIGDPAVGEWIHYKVPIADLLAHSGSSLDLAMVNTPLVIFPNWGNQEGVVMQVDNVAWTR
jgi:beta-glucanase (GH16 family)